MTEQSSYTFDEFFASGKEESISPFLKPASRAWGQNLKLRTAIFSAGLLLCAFVSSFFLPSLSSLLLLFVYFLSGTPALIRAIEDVKKREINIEVLMTLAAYVAAILGCAIDGALLLVLFEFSAAIEARASKRTKDALLSLDRFFPRIACCVREDGSIYERAVKEIQVGTNLLVRAGEMVPLDGIILDGNAFVDLSHLTGESLPIAKKKGR